eukprot:TRINITY_DN121_c1_g1_i3.p1 TRINITY_DN121_c1_g1~~TRINITY_DN121_c1_g1_i3.p1  ORF type:complete len:489 (+),score=290.93 TRINITY_DN121_c1_g1_i3:143-1609(+)
MSVDQAVTNLLARLESVAARLEKVEKQLVSGASVATSTSAAVSSSSSGAAGSDFVAPPFVGDYQALIDQFIKPLVSAVNSIGLPELKAQIELVQKAVNSQLAFLNVAAQSKKPTADALQKLLEPTSKLMGEISSIRDKNRPSKQFNHLSAISEGIPALAWVCITPTPGPHVDEARSSSEFYSNKILMEFKGKDENQVAFVHNWNTFLKELRAYIKKYHTTEVTWNPRGVDASAATATTTTTTASAGGPPAPPPGPPPTIHLDNDKTSRPDSNALFSALNKGEGVTTGLKKVTADMKSKNRTDKSSVVPAATTSKPTASRATAAAGAAKKGPARVELVGNKWFIENQDNNRSIEINETAPNQSILIYKCDNSVIKISGKVNNISVDASKKTGIVFHDAISVAELVNCNSIELQVTGKVPSVAIDKCSGVQLFLSAASLEAEIVTSKSSEMNVLIPGATPDADLVEIPIPEQYKSLVRAGKLVTETVHHA